MTVRIFCRKEEAGLDQKISYHLMDPTKNYTLLIDTPVPEEDQAAVAAELMRRFPLAEQAGFIGPVSDRDPADTDIALSQPGGTLRIARSTDGRLLLSGSVRV